MEFISNLIKRPISLVLSDSVEVSSSPTSSNCSSNSPNAQLRERCSLNNNNNNSNSSNNNAHNMQKNHNNNKSNMNCRNSSPTTPDVAHEGNKIVMLPLLVDVGAGGDGLHTGGHCDFENAQPLNSSASSNSTSSTIEELLIRINDNLNQASLQNQSDVQDQVKSHETLSGVATLSPLATKSSSSHKLSQSPHPQTPTTPTAFIAPSSPNVAAGSAVIDVNALKINSDAVAGKLDKTHLILNNNNTGVTKKNKFVGLTEFDESKIPELPESLNPSISDQLKLTFDEDLIPTLTASSNTQLNLPPIKKDFTNTTNTIDLGYGENNTSLSEADTYRSALNSYNNTTIGIGTGDESKQLDETLENIADIGDEVFEVTSKPVSKEPWPDMMSTKNETQLAMLHNATFDGNDIEPMDVDLNDTHELAYTTNVTMEADRLHCAAADATALISELVRESGLDEYKNIPDFTESTNAKIVSNETSSADVIETALSPGSGNNLSNHQQQMLSAASIELPVTENKPIVDNTDIAQLKQVNNVELTATTSTQLVTDDHSNQSKMMMANKSLNVIQDNSVDSATDVIQAIDEPSKTGAQAILNTLGNQENTSTNALISSSMSEAVEELDGSKLCEKEPISSPSSSSASVSNKVENKLKLPLEINTSLEITSDQKPPLQSPSFPIKAAMNAKYFPRSPDVPTKPMIFLEKSEYSVEDVLIVTPSKKDITTKALPSNLNKTLDMSDANNMAAMSPLSTSNRSSSIVSKSTNNSSTSLNCTFDGASSLPSPTMTSSATILEVTSADKRQTFIASPTPELQQENSFNSSRPNSRLTFNVMESETNTSSTVASTIIESQANSVDKRLTFNASPTLNSQSDKSSDSSRANSRLTFNVVEAEEIVNNQSVEAMDVDSSMQAVSSEVALPRSESSISPSTSITCSSSSNAALEQLSAKEQTKSNAKDEKDIFVEKSSPSVVEDIFKPPALGLFNGMGGAQSSSSTAFDAHSSQMPDEFGDEDFQNNLILNPSDFDYLLTKGNNNVQIDRSSLLLRFDPLLGVPIPVNQPQQQQQQLQQILANNNSTASYLTPTLEEDEHLNDNNRSFVVESVASVKPKTNPKQSAPGSVQCCQQLDISQEPVKPKKNVRMSVDVIKDMKIENDCNKSIEHSNTQSDDTENNIKMDELEKKIKNEVLKTEDIEKKLKEAEQREEALIKRITEKDKKIAKMNDVIEAYEKAIAELISEKEQLIQNYEKQLTEVKADRDSNYHHLTSLETTFSDLHVKYEKSKEMTSQLKSSEESLLAEKKQNLENLRLQEQRYEKMKNHAMQQLEIANKKLESLTKEHAIESTKLKALLKKEEISRASINEQLQQKSRENSELVKICDELINGQGS